MRHALQRLGAGARCDAELEWRNGLHIATAFALAVSAAILLALPKAHLAPLLPAVALNNLAITSFFFMVALALLERSEGLPLARAVTPLRPAEYLGAKVATLTAIGLAQHAALALLAGVAPARLPAVLAGVALASAMLALAGFCLATRYQALNELLLPSVPCLALLEAPLLADLTQWDGWLLYLHPVQAPMVLMRAAAGPISGWQAGYALAYGALWVAALSWLAARAYRRWEIDR